MNEPPRQPRPLRFAPEQPLTLDELECLDAQRLEPVIDTLVQGLHGHWNAAGVAKTDTARVWGLLGGLGQGKSTVVKETIRRLQSEEGKDIDAIRPQFRITSWFFRVNQRWCRRRMLDVKLLEASVLSSNHLSVNLISRLVLPRLLLWALPALLLTPGLLLLGVYFVLGFWGQQDGVFALVQYMAWAIPALIGLPLVSSWLAWSNEQHQAGYWERSIYRLAEKLGVNPDLVVLDDLDRATVEQQRAVLRTLVRHTGLMRCPLVVSFDESDLLASDPNPEEPAELLRKLIQVPLRLPPRSREDAVLLAWGAVQVWHRCNPERSQWGAFLLNPVWVGHLTRLMLATHTVGPRQAKYLLAEAVAATAAMQSGKEQASVNLDNAGGLLLLSAIYQIQPLLRRDPELLVACLEAGGDQAAWAQWMKHPRATEFSAWAQTNPRPAACLRSLLLRADTMMPVRTSWRKLVVGRSIKQQTAVGENKGCHSLTMQALGEIFKHNGSAPSIYDVFLDFGQALDGILMGVGGTNVFDKLLSKLKTDRFSLDRPKPASDDELDQFSILLIWPLLISALASSDVLQRSRLFTAIDRWLARMKNVPSTEYLRMHWAREWCTDEVWQTDGGRIAPEMSWLHENTEKETSLGTRLVLARSLRRYAPSQKAMQDTWKHLIELSQHGVEITHLSNSVAIGETIPLIDWAQEDKNLNDVTAFSFWPPVRHEPGQETALIYSLRQHMQAIRDLYPAIRLAELKNELLASARDTDNRPHALLAWTASPQAQCLDLRQWLHVLAPLSMPTEADSDWSFSHWRFFLYHEPLVMRKIPLALGSLDGHQWKTAFCLLTQRWAAQFEVQDRQKLWDQLMVGRPEKPDASFVKGALEWWSQSEPMFSDTYVQFGLVLLTQSQAKDLWTYLLNHARIMGVGCVVDTCMQKFKLYKPDAPEQTEWYTDMRLIAEKHMGVQVNSASIFLGDSI